MTVWCGIDWGERHHDVALFDDDGQRVARRKISDDLAGFRALLELLAQHIPAGQPVTVAIETPKGLLVAAMVAAGLTVVPVNPFSAARYRDRHSPSRAKSDPGDALMLANILRTDREAHRPLPADSELALEIRVLARAQQDAVWSRVAVQNKLRSLLRDYYPAALVTLPELDNAQARAALRLMPTPAAAATVRRPSLRAALVKAGRRRDVDSEVTRIRDGLQTDALRQPAGAERAMGVQALALLGALDAACKAAVDLEQALVAAFAKHPDHALITSLPGLGEVLGARVLAEIGDDRNRFPDKRGFKSFAGSAPITRASGRMHHVSARRIRNRRLADAVDLTRFGGHGISD